MKAALEFYGATAPVKVCNFWEFLPEVKRQELYRRELEVQIAHVPHSFGFGKMSASSIISDEEMVRKTTHILTQTPSKMVTELKKTTTGLVRKSKHLKLDELIYEFSALAAYEMGYPTHLLPIGTHTYALVGIEDLRLFQDGFNTTLVCTAPHRNFHVYAPYLITERR